MKRRRSEFRPSAAAALGDLTNRLVMLATEHRVIAERADAADCRAARYFLVRSASQAQVAAREMSRFEARRLRLRLSRIGRALRRSRRSLDAAGVALCFGE